MTEKHKLCTIPLLSQRRDFVLQKIESVEAHDSLSPQCPYILNLVVFQQTQAIDDDPGQGASEVDDFVHDERHDASGQDIILHPSIPGGPQSLNNIEVSVVL